MPALLCPFHLHSAAPPRPPFIDTQVLKAHLSELLPGARDSSPVSASQHSLVNIPTTVRRCSESSQSCHCHW
ncbi:hypothetical protein WG66_013462 [Moniliophthora roreri]|nr:hypothetical protein WG66_013463 [Moniliophthora roreri]KAI3599217.1 hypothetical protein WG66_013462 [Moniliophthora roreri]